MKETCSVRGFVVRSVSRCYSNADVKVKLRRRWLFAWQDGLNVPFVAGQKRLVQNAGRGQELHTTPGQESEVLKNGKRKTWRAHVKFKSIFHMPVFMHILFLFDCDGLLDGV